MNQARYLTSSDVRKMLAKACKIAGSQGAFARQHSVSRTMVCHTLNKVIEPPPKICAALKIKRVEIGRYTEDGAP